MTHEPDIIREAEAIVEAYLERPVRFKLDIPPGSVITHAYVRLNTPLHGLDNPEPTVRVAAEPWRDAGDEDRNAR